MHLYIIQSSKNGSFKIGRSNNPEKRISQLQTGSPYKLKIILVLKNMGYLEKSIHRNILTGNKRSCRGEWFDFELSSYIPDNIYEKIDLDSFNTWWE
jgi:hypothetical protein